MLRRLLPGIFWRFASRNKVVWHSRLGYGARVLQESNNARVVQMVPRAIRDILLRENSAEQLAVRSAAPTQSTERGASWQKSALNAAR